ncbi:MAG: DUF4870 domain-containing protein [Chloroflexota bacterium]
MEPTKGERLLATLAHASVLTNIANLTGLILATLIWTTQQEKSTFIRFQALQAVVYQSFMFAIGMFLILIWVGCLGFALIPVAIRPDLYTTSPPNVFWLALIGFIVPLGFAFVAMLYGMYGALQVYRGKPFTYALVGRWVHTITNEAYPASGQDNDKTTHEYTNTVSVGATIPKETH